jgi:2-phosphosulfolactate phosphatase
MIEFHRATLGTCSQATGTVVAIDVLRAFSTAAYAFAAGARDITLVSTVAEALALRDRMPGALAMGEADGLRIPGFDLSNSPVEVARQDLTGRRLIQRTSAGTQGVVRSQSAETILAASFCNAGATAEAIRQLTALLDPLSVTFVITGQHSRDWGDEDAACADYIESLLNGQTLELAMFLERVRLSSTGQLFTDPDQPDFNPADLDYCLAVDRFDFAMPVERRDGTFVMKRSV